MFNPIALDMDITPGPIQDETWARERLTTYEQWTISPREAKKATPKGEERVPVWHKVQRYQTGAEDKDIIASAKGLDDTEKVLVRQGELGKNQARQVDLLLEEKNKYEPSATYVWTLYQLKRETRLIEKKVKATTRLTVYIKRAPRKGIDCLALLRSLQHPEFNPAWDRPMIQNGSTSHSRHGSGSSRSTEKSHKSSSSGKSHKSSSSGESHKSSSSGKSHKSTSSGDSHKVPIYVLAEVLRGLNYGAVREMPVDYDRRDVPRRIEAHSLEDRAWEISNRERDLARREEDFVRHVERRGRSYGAPGSPRRYF